MQTPPVITQDQILAHSVHYAASTCPIKDDIQQLAGCWVSDWLFAGQLSLQPHPAGMLTECASFTAKRRSPALGL